MDTSISILKLFASHHLSEEQFGILLRLAEAARLYGDRPVPLSAMPKEPHDPGTRSHEASQSRSLRRLAGRGLVKRYVDTTNGRNRLAKITPEGKAIITSIVGKWPEPRVPVEA